MLSIILILWLIILIFLLYTGIITLHQPHIISLQKFKFIYLEYQYDYDKIINKFIILSKIKKDLKLDTMNFQLAAFYFDNPDILKDQNLGRSALGFIINEDSDKEKIKNLEKLDFKIIELPSIKACRKVLLLNLFIVFKFMGRVYNNFLKCIEKINGNSDSVVALEIYYSNEFEAHYWFGKNIETFKFSSFKIIK